MTSPSTFKVAVNDYLSALVLVLPISIYFIIIVPKLFITLATHTYSLIFIFAPYTGICCMSLKDFANELCRCRCIRAGN